MTRCAQGHFYDAQKHAACPYCAVSEEPKAVPMMEPAMAPQTRPFARVETPTPAAGVPGATRALHRDVSGVSPVVGWLVCIEGPDRGQDYRIHAEKNFIGRARNMDIAIAGDDNISREKHAIVLFDPKKRAFWLQPGDASGLVYVNGELVHSPFPVKADDVIELGRTKLVLVPFVGEKFQWA